MKKEIKDNMINDPLWEKAKELVDKGEFEKANKIVGQIYRKYGQKYN